MKNTLLLTLLILSACGSGIKLLVLDPALSTGVGQAAVLQLPGSSYPIRHNLAGVRSMNFPVHGQKALLDAIASKRKEWRLSLPANLEAADPSLPARFAILKDAPDKLTPEDRSAMATAAGTLGLRYVLLIESISIKDVSSPQLPMSLLVGAALQVWDFETGKIVFRSKGVSRTLSYQGDDFKSKLEEGLTDLFSDLLAPLPKK